MNWGTLHFVLLKRTTGDYGRFSFVIELVKANASKVEEIAQYLSQKHPSYAEEFAELCRQAKEETSF